MGTMKCTEQRLEIQVSTLCAWAYRKPFISRSRHHSSRSWARVRGPLLFLFFCFVLRQGLVYSHSQSQSLAHYVGKVALNLLSYFHVLGAAGLWA